MGAEFSLSDSHPAVTQDELQAAVDGWIYQRPPGWSHIATYPADKWKAPLASMWGFDYYEEWQRRNFKVHKRPWSNFSVTARNYSGKEEKVCSFTCEVYETGREERISGWVKDFRVLAFHPKVIVVQVCLSKAVKLLVVNWHTNHLLGTYSFGFHKEPCFQECYLTPDASMMLCRQDFVFRRKLHHVSSFDSNIRVIEIKDGLCKRLFVIEDRLYMNVLGSGIALDPRCPTGRLAMIGNTSQVASLSSEMDGHRLYDMKQRRLISSCPSDIEQGVHHIQYTPDGRLLAAVLVNISIYINCTVSVHSVHIFDSTTLDTVRVLPLVHTEFSKIGTIKMFPMFSRNGSILAQICGDSRSPPLVKLYQMPCHDACLQDSCRSVILRCTPKRLIGLLPLPQSLLGFLQFLDQE